MKRVRLGFRVYVPSAAAWAAEALAQRFRSVHQRVAKINAAAHESSMWHSTGSILVPEGQRAVQHRLQGARVQDAGAVLGNIYWHTLAGGNGKLKY
jgi:hypothetical protein